MSSALFKAIGAVGREHYRARPRESMEFSNAFRELEAEAALLAIRARDVVRDPSPENLRRLRELLCQHCEGGGVDWFDDGRGDVYGDDCRQCVGAARVQA